jgi:hypothetical protein
MDLKKFSRISSLKCKDVVIDMSNRCHFILNCRMYGYKWISMEMYGCPLRISVEEICFGYMPLFSDKFPRRGGNIRKYPVISIPSRIQIYPDGPTSQR